MAYFTTTPAKALKVWDGKDPLEVLTPHEVAAAELYARLYTDPTIPRDRQGRITWGGAFRETFGCDLASKTWNSLRRNKAWQLYVTQLRTQTRDTVLKKLEGGAMAALQDYIWSRQTAKAKGDYKEVRLGAQDYLDRLGATMKPTVVEERNVVVILRGANFDQHTLAKPLPMLEAEIVQEEPDGRG